MPHPTPSPERPSPSVPLSAPPCRSVLMVGTHLDNTGGIRAVVRAYVDAGLFERFDGLYIATHRSGSPWLKAKTALTAWLAVAIQLKKLDAPLVHIHTASRASFWRKSVICLMARATGRPYVLHVHGGGFAKFYDESPRPAQRFIRNILANAAVVLALSEQWKETLLRICPTAKVEVLPNAVTLPDLSNPRAAPSPTRERPTPDLPAVDGPTLLFLGDLNRPKGTFDLVAAFAQVAPRFPTLKLVCGGSGALPELQQLATQLGMPDRVLFPGWLDPARKAAELERATIFILPSYAEGMPMALLEAMSYRLPVITSPVGGIPQLIESEVNGLLSAPGDVTALAAAIARLMADPVLRDRLGTAARATIETGYSLDVALERLTQIYARFGIHPHRPESSIPSSG